MKIAVVGGGPAGAYFAILAAKAWPKLDITIFERNSADDTFGFGVVFSDETLDTFQKYDRESYEAIAENFAYWDDIEIHFKGNVDRIGGNGFCGCARTTLLKLLHDRARALGVKLNFETEVDPSLAGLKGYDLIVAADGSNSRIRETYRDHFQTEIDYRPNKFAWMGSTRSFDAFTFFFKQTEYGIFIAHCYQYEPGRSTWVMEVQPETFERAGLERLSEEESARFLERIFADELAGHKLMTNRSMWRNFPRVSNKRWVRNNAVLLGDAKATAHFSIGSGTKLAMEDSIALFEALSKTRLDIPAALSHYETARREDVEKTQHAADVSLVWFEHVDRFWDTDPRQFAFGLMTRSKAITWDNLQLRAPEFVDKARAMFAEGVAEDGLQAAPKTPPMFQPFKLREMTVPNRTVVSPMCQYSAKDGVPNEWHLVHLGTRAIGGAGLIFTEMTDVSEDARISPGCAGIYTDVQEAALEENRRFRACELGVENLSPTWPCRAQRRHQINVGGHRRAAYGGRLADHRTLAASLLSAQRRAARNDARRHGPGESGFRCGRKARGTRWLRHAGTALRARLPACDFYFTAHEPAPRRIWRLARQSPSLSARSLPRNPRGLAAR